MNHPCASTLANWWLCMHSVTAPLRLSCPGRQLSPSGKVIGSAELCAMTDAVLDGWLTTGRFNEAFDNGLPASWACAMC